MGIAYVKWLTPTDTLSLVQMWPTSKQLDYMNISFIILWRKSSKRYILELLAMLSEMPIPAYSCSNISCLKSSESESKEESEFSRLIFGDVMMPRFCLSALTVP